jgi:methionyl-tRNA formyltransferase
MKLIILADKVVGLHITQFLLKEYPEDLSLVVTTQENEIYYLVKNQGIPVTIFDSEEGVKSRLTEIIDLGVMAWWPKILKTLLLEIPIHGFINTHPSLLPYNRGKHYNFWALVEQAPFGVTLHRVDSGVDTGDIVAQKKIPYDWCDTGGTLYIKAQEAIESLFYQTYPMLRTGIFDSTRQKTDGGSFHHSYEMDQASFIDLDQIYRGRDLINLLRARTFEGYPACTFKDSGNHYEISVKIRKVS